MINSSEIKKIARNKLSGKWSKALSISTLYTMIILALSFCLNYIRNLTINTPILSFASLVIYSLALISISYGLISVLVKLINKKNIVYTDLINDTILNASKSIGIFFRTIFGIILPIIVTLVVSATCIYLTSKIYPITWDSIVNYMFLFILIYFISLIIILLLMLPYSLANYVLANNNNFSAKEAVLKSISLMYGNKWNFIKLIISFFGWFILITICSKFVSQFINFNYFIETISSIIIIPYMIVSINVFFEELDNVKVEVIDNNPNANANNEMEKNNSTDENLSSNETENVNNDSSES